MASFSLAKLRFCARECERQQSGEMSVYNMYRALSELLAFQRGYIKPTPEMIQHLGRMIEPIKNQGGFRKQPVTIKGNVLRNQDTIEREIENLCAAWHTLTADEWYVAFQKVHPFNDGNGRLGALLWNRSRGTLEYPVCPPDFFSKEGK